jgi:peptide deformylase
VSVRPLRILGDPVLRTACEPVTRFDAGLGRLVDDLLETVVLPGRAGLAAPQIGVSLAAFSYYLDGQHGYVVNPVITETAGLQDGPEGCLSVPGITAWTTRAARAVVTGVDRHGAPVTVEGTGELSRCLQHEVDHLSGLLYLDRLTGQHRRDALRQLRDIGRAAGAADRAIGDTARGHPARHTIAG